MATNPRSQGAINEKVSRLTASAGPEPPSSENPTPDHLEYLPNWKLYQVVFGLSVSYFLILLNSTVAVTAIPSITSNFNSIQDVGWYGSAYLLSNCALQPLSGKIYTYHSLKYTFLSFLAIFELGSLVCAVSISSPMFIIGRAIAGSGASGIMNGAMTIIVACAPPTKRPYLVGFAVAFGAVGQVMGPLLGGVLTQHLSWRWSFYINIPFGGATAVLFLLTRIPEQRKKERNASWKGALLELDLIGFFIFAPSVIMLLLALSWRGNPYLWKSATVIDLLCGASVTFWIFLCWEKHKGDDAMIPLKIFYKRRVTSSYITGFFQVGALVEMTYFLPLWFQTVKGDTPTMSGVDILPTIGSQIFFAAITGILVSRVGYFLPFSVAGSVMLAVGAGLMSTLTSSEDVNKYVGYQILAGAGRGIVQQIPVVVVQGALSVDEVAIGTSILALVQYLGAAIFLLCANIVFNSSLVSSLQDYAPKVNATSAIAAGATELKDIIAAADLPGVLLAFNKAITQTFYIAAISGVITVFSSFGMGWAKIKNLQETKDS